MFLQRGQISSQLLNEFQRDYETKTLVIDIIGTLITHVKLDQADRNDKQKFIVVDIKNKRSQNSCACSSDDLCRCHLFAFKIRPHAKEFLRVIRHFGFELICFSKTNKSILEGIIEHFESILSNVNAVIPAYCRLRINNEAETYFNYIFSNKFYSPYYNIDIENFKVLFENRYKDDMIFISSCPASVVAAMKQSIPTIPVESFNYINEDDELLLMVEDYMMQTNN